MKMNTLLPLQEELLATTKTSDIHDRIRTISGNCITVKFDFSESNMPRFPSFNSYVQRKISEDPTFKEGLSKARKTLAKHEGNTLRKLRLSHGYSQTELAELMGTKQPFIARIESDPSNITAATIKKLAKALKVEPLTVFKCIENYE